ncbi:endoglucanase [Spirochaetia bacterium]|nr:endoglucanase [Spirochaetia bacterium]
MSEKVAVRPPFFRGFNFSHWFEVRAVKDIPFTLFTKKDLEDVKALGVDHIRIPMRSNDFTTGHPDWKLDPLYLQYLDQALDWAEDLGLYLLLDNHTFNNRVPDGEDEYLEEALCKVWTQLAEHYKDRSNLVVYEIFNEPHGITSEKWGAIQGHVIDAIRKVDTKHSLIVGGVDFNSIGNLEPLPEYADKNLIYTFHYYDPHVFTHQGAPWDSIPLTNLRAMPFPADPARMPKLPDDLKGTYYEKVFADYAVLTARETMEKEIARAVTFANKRKVPIFCGEFGVFKINSLSEDRVRWHELVLELFESRDIGWTIWDWRGAFGVFKTEKGGDIRKDLDPGIIRALNLTPLK